MSMKTKETDQRRTALGCLFALVMLPVNIVLWSYVTLQMYGWFVLPVFPAMPALTLIQMIGLRWMVGILTVETPKRKYTDAEKYGVGEQALMNTILALLIWGMAAILKTLMG